MMEVFECQRCGSCCKLAGLLVPHLAPIYRAIFLPGADGSCRHLLKDGEKYKCKIYDQRPTLCRVDKMAKIREEDMGISEEESFALAKKACRVLREGK